MENWNIAFAVVILAFLSFLLANGIAMILEIRQKQRIYKKTTALAQSNSASVQKDKDSTSSSPLKSVPVTLLTGFLGSGKTTLLNHILCSPDLPYRMLVLENELGKISIDCALLESARLISDSGIYVLPNGCMCCKVGGNASTNELERVLDHLLLLVKQQEFDYLIVETSGLADVGIIVESFLHFAISSKHTARFQLDGVVTMVDGYTSAEYWDEISEKFDFPIEFCNQILFADIVVINKMDLVKNQEHMENLKLAITSLNPNVKILQCENGNLPIENLLHLNAFDLETFQQRTPDLSHGMRRLHSSNITTVNLELHPPALLSLEKIQTWLNHLMKKEIRIGNAKRQIVRMKGVLIVMENPLQKCIFQSVLGTWTIVLSEKWTPEDAYYSRLVIIGYDLDQHALEKGFFDCIGIAASNENSTERSLDRLKTE